MLISLTFLISLRSILHYKQDRRMNEQIRQAGNTIAARLEQTWSINFTVFLNLTSRSRLKRYCYWFVILSIIISFIIITVIVLPVLLDICKISKVAEDIISTSIEAAVLGWPVIAEKVQTDKNQYRNNVPTMIIVSEHFYCQKFSHNYVLVRNWQTSFNCFVWFNPYLYGLR